MEISKTALIDWYYPEIYDILNQDYLEINLMHTRASDGIRIKYDSERDGFVIEQPVWEDDLVVGWKETAFCKSWIFDIE